ncbi:hypothetical protein [Bacillus clarus]|uniref:hypothetical protein n=1 Tax=Bacillus clarus TaxID=2338372 RepID=UPI000A6EE148|nr:hypothetical protein [Bacillus clarus]
MNFYEQQPLTQDSYYRNQHWHPQHPLKQQTIAIISPAVSHGLREATHLGYQHA